MRMMNYGQLKELIGYSRTHLRRLMFDPKYQDRRFPRPLVFGGRIRWIEDEVRQWLSERPRLRPRRAPQGEGLE